MRRDLIQVGKTYRNGKVERTVTVMQRSYVNYRDNKGRRDFVSLSNFCRWAKFIVDDPNVCRWDYDDLDGKYDGSCGAAIILLEGTPKENDYNFCPKCGKPIEVTK